MQTYRRQLLFFGSLANIMAGATLHAGQFLVSGIMLIAAVFLLFSAEKQY
jgi:hypothetical protein